MKREKLLLFTATLLAAALVTNHSYVENDLSRVAAIESIVERHTFAIDGASAAPVADKLLVGGRYYSSKPPMLSLIGAVPYYVLNKLGLSFRSDAAASYFLLTLSVIGVSTSLLGVLFYDSLRRRGLSVTQGLALTAVLLAATPVFNYTASFNSHTVSAALLFAGFYFLLEAGRSVSGGAGFFLAGLSVGLCAGIDQPAGFVFTAAYLAYVLWTRKSLKHAAAYCAGAALPILVYFALNVYTLGDVWPRVFHPEYYRYRGAEFFTESVTSIDGYRPVPRGEYAFNSLFGVQGFFSNTPFLLASVAVFAATVLDRKSRLRTEALFVGAGCLALEFFYLAFTSGYGGVSYGFRWMIPAIPLLAYFTAAFFEGERSELQYGVFLFAAFTSFFMSLTRHLSSSDSPWVSYTPPDFLTVLAASAVMAAFIVLNPPLRRSLVDALRPAGGAGSR